MADNEKLMRAALVAIQTLQRKCDALTKRCAELEGDLAKARGTSPPKVQDAIVDALRKTRRGGSAWHLLGGMAEAQKSRTERESASREERITKAEELLRKASGR